MPTRNGKTFGEPSLSARELRMRSRVAKERAEAAAEATEAAAEAAAVALVPFIPPIESPVHAANLQQVEPKKPKKKPKKPKKKPKKLTVTKRFPFGIPEPLVKSFDDFFEATCRVDFTNSGTKDSGLLTVGDVHKTYRAWCAINNRPYCPERTSKQWNRAPFVVNAKKIDKLAPFRLLMFAKLERMPKRSKDVFSTTQTAWRRHKKTYAGFPYYKGLQWKEEFTPTEKYIRKK